MIPKRACAFSSTFVQALKKRDLYAGRMDLTLAAILHLGPSTSALASRVFALGEIYTGAVQQWVHDARDRAAQTGRWRVIAVHLHTLCFQLVSNTDSGR